MHEILAVPCLDVPPTLARTLRSTNAIESVISGWIASAAMEVSHLEILPRHVLADRLAAAGRSSSWLDDTARELDDRARKNIAEARQWTRAKSEAAGDGQTLSELPFKFWRFLLAKRYTTLGPTWQVGFPVLPIAPGSPSPGHPPARVRTVVCTTVT